MLGFGVRFDACHQSDFRCAAHVFEGTVYSVLFQVCGHKWASLAEYDWGVAVLNDSKYGWSCINNILRLSL